MTATGPFKVTQGHRICYQSKARMDFLLVNNTNIMSYLAPFLRYRGALVKLSLLTGRASVQLSQRQMLIPQHHGVFNAANMYPIITPLYGNAGTGAQP